MTTVQFDRLDEATFRALVPRQIGAFTILEVSGFRPGCPGLYASAFVLVDSGGRNRYSTHRIICADDWPDGQLHWYFEHGHYDYATRADAWEDLIKRARGN